MLINKISQEHSKHKIKVDEISRSQPYLKLHVRFTTVPTSAAENSLLVVLKHGRVQTILRNF